MPDETKRENIKIFEKDKNLSFHIEKSPFDNKKVKVREISKNIGHVP